MLLPRFDFHEPASIDEACEIMATFGPKAKLLAGGTDLMVNMKKKILAPENLVCLSKIESMHGIAEKGDQIVIGGRYTVAELTTDPLVEKKLGALRSGARALGSPLVRNRATIAGNIGSARPASDLPPSLIAYGATVILVSSKGEREVLLGNFFKGPGFTELRPEEVLTEIRVPTPTDGQGAGYINLGVRKAQDCNVVNVASYIELDEKDGSIKKARIVMGSVGPTPLRAGTAESVLLGQKPDEALFLKAGEAARQDCTPIDDFRGSASYRKAMVGVLTKRTLDIAHRQASGA
ncbi:dehydrogenase [Desulfosarcina ovata subsp. sediminis]|uniref:Dehydrogenase n=1 Tax=Desulfosarcina ovata subsp. sediminis TaxID=885957 RepID=A0A5K8A181_9BACT|nr:xanthine dehydrogenase family protein subunit M [Desulfosarcina ovata]BBO86227.1 dehydrogenase [Desulfosarcina ovata subsp. sediminis]